MKTCTRDDCTRQVRCKGLCALHYDRALRGRPVDYSTRYERGISLAERINRYVAETPTGCWEWQGSKTAEGYGHMFVNGRTRQAHRLSYETFVGPIPEGLQLDHLCVNPPCVNPAHLEPVSPRENSRRAREGRLV